MYTTTTIFFLSKEKDHQYPVMREGTTRVDGGDALMMKLWKKQQRL